MSEAAPIGKPLPLPDEESRPFFDGAMAGRLMLMRCTACGAARLPSRQHCPGCLSGEYTWFEASGRGTLRSFGVMHQRYHPGFAGELPYNIAVVELEEGPRIPANIVGVANADLQVDMAVVVEWERHEDVALPKFRPA